MDQNFQFLTPEALHAMEATSGSDEKMKMLEEQIAQAKALGAPGPAHTSPGGAVFGGIANILNAKNSKQKQDELRKQQGVNLDQRGAANKALIDALIQQRAMRQGGGIQPQGAPQQQAPGMIAQPQPGDPAWDWQGGGNG